MPTLRTLCGLSAAAAAAAAAAVSPGAAAAGSGPPGHIVFRDVNILAVTDVHSWIAGGDRQVPQGTPPLDATFGDLTSLKERAQEAAAKEGAEEATSCCCWQFLPLRISGLGEGERI